VNGKGVEFIHSVTRDAVNDGWFAARVVFNFNSKIYASGNVYTLDMCSHEDMKKTLTDTSKLRLAELSRG
jgi:hypothetical protein